MRVCVVGAGLIGGSLGLALRAHSDIEHVIGLGRRAEPLQRGVAMGALDDWQLEPDVALAEVDVIVLGVPLGAMAPVLRWIAPHRRKNAIITDVGSAKGCVVEDAIAVWGELPPQFVPAHPIAGTEHSGIDAAVADLFVNRRVILTPTPETAELASDTVTRLWTMAGASVVRMSVDEHDRMLAMTSHLPHMLAFGLVDLLAGASDRDEMLRYAAGGFRDFTRIASSDPVMWRDICLGNRTALLEALGAYRGDLETLSEAVASADGEALEAIFSRAKQTRDAYRHWFET